MTHVEQVDTARPTGRFPLLFLYEYSNLYALKLSLTQMLGYDSTLPLSQLRILQ